MNDFRQFALSENIFKALDALQFTTPTKIQEQAIPMLLAKDNIDFHGQASTGTGKTLAFLIPILQKINLNSRDTQALIVAPTRELVLQITESLDKLSKFCEKISITPIYGGVSIDNQTRILKRGVHIVIGTPGRLNDHIRRRNLSLKNLRTLVLDEADIMLDMGFKQEIDSILLNTNKDRQIWLFSATTKGGIALIKKKHMKDPASVRIIKKNVAAKNTEQYFCVAPMRYRFDALSRFIDTVTDFYGIVFCQTKILTAEVAQTLSKRGYNVASLHGDMDQKLRNKVIKKFKDRFFDILIATDVAARGIDVNSLTHVINYSLPDNQENYIHRIGRTGRAGKKGIAITFVNTSQVRRMKSLARMLKTEINPIEVPVLADVMKVKINKALEYFNELCNKEQTINGILDPLRASINSLSRDDLANGTINILSDTFLNGCDKEVEMPDFSAVKDSDGYRSSSRYEGRRRNNSNISEIVLHIGSDDGINKSDVFNHFINSKAVSRSQIERVRVIKRRSFVTVPSSIAKKVLSALKGKNFQRRRVRVGLIKS